jgi:hypothetical protein
VHAHRSDGFLRNLARRSALEACFRETESKNSKQRTERKSRSRRKNPVALKAEFGSPRRKSRRADGTRQIEKLVIAASQDGMDPPMLIQKSPNGSWGDGKE